MLSINRLSAALQSGKDCLGDPDFWQGVEKIGKKNAPVYGAPYGKSAWRGAKGKAAVSLRDGLCLLRGYTNSNGESWTCVSYEVSERTSRIGWVENSLLGSAALHELGEEENTARLLAVPVQATRDTFLTDDPYVSQYAQFSVSAGTSLRCMGTQGSDWAYVAAEVNKKGTFVDDGAMVWGFVPLRDLALMEHLEPQEEVIAELVGYWHYADWKGYASSLLSLNANGTYVAA